MNGAKSIEGKSEGFAHVYLDIRNNFPAILSIFEKFFGIHGNCSNLLKQVIVKNVNNLP